ncbi:zinc finger protein 436-like [Leptidea sinapis]|uniref:zinc finger protein 436-like n=1 Tax=Leptidea sinapis TaxID=189913 RepID=UPI00212FE522|nr:zinc finger protein 436-like [Leptidea sinapis]
MEKIEREYLLGRCKCCLDDTDLQSMWEEHFINGEPEVYGELAIQCFGLNWHLANDEDVICNACIGRLRDAVNFKNEIIASEQLLLEGLSDNIVNNDIEVKVECIDDSETEYLEINTNESKDFKQECEEFTDPHEEFSDPHEEFSDPHEEFDEFEQIPNHPKNCRGKDGSASYKQYTRLQLRDALKAISDKKMTRSEAAKAYNIPLRTLCTKINTNAIIEVQEEEKSKNMKFVEEIKTILKNTNATPFKTKSGRYYCVYCSTDGRVFHKGSHLRSHTATKHYRERITQVEHFMKPYWFNEVLKLDIHDLTCKICKTKLPEWNDMFQHFADMHNIGYDEAYTRVIPYRITKKLECALCRSEFSAYHVLDSHMNAHYNNYICHQCGETFLAGSRLDKHVQVHSRGQFPCEVCGKVFTVEKYRMKHYNYTHKKKKVFKCLYCVEEFELVNQRQEHIIEKHKDVANLYTCQHCGKVYYKRQNFIRHMQRRHIRDKKYKCKHCDMSFIMKYELNSHMIKHVQEKKFFCTVCDEGFTRKITLKTHLKRIHKQTITNF